MTQQTRDWHCKPNQIKSSELRAQTHIHHEGMLRAVVPGMGKAEDVGRAERLDLVVVVLPGRFASRRGRSGTCTGGSSRLQDRCRRGQDLDDLVVAVVDVHLAGAGGLVLDPPGGGGGGGDRACDAEDRRLEPALDLLDGVADGRFWRCSHAMAASSSELSLSDSSCWSSVNSCVDDRSRVSFSGV